MRSRGLSPRVCLVALALFLSSLSAQAAPAKSDGTRSFALCDAYCAIVDAQGKRIIKHDGNKYQSRRRCTQLYDDDETPLLFCDMPESSNKKNSAAAEARP